MIQHIEDRKKYLARIFKEHGMPDITVKAERHKVDGDQPDSGFKFEDYKEDIGHQEGDVIDLQDFYEWTREQQVELEENGLFLVPSRALTEDEHERVEPALKKFFFESTSHGLFYEVVSDADPELKLSFQYHLNMS